MKRIILFLLGIQLSFNAVSQNNDGDSLFNAPIIHDVYLSFSQPGYWDSLVANYTADVYMKCSVTLDGRVMPNVGVKFKGNSSYNNPSQKKSWKLDLDLYDSLQDYNDLKKLNLNNGFKDPSMLREKVMLDYCAWRGIHAPRCAFARVYLNGTYWGLYTLVEEINKDFLDDDFYDKRGNLFKGDPTGDLKWYGSAASSYYAKYELKTNETQNNWSDLVHLIDEINNSTSVEFRDSLEAVMITSGVINSWAATNLFANLDSYLGSGHNYFMYHDSITNRFNWIPWDVNEAFGNFTMGLSSTQLKNLSIYYVSSSTNRPLYNKMLANTQYKAEYTAEMCFQVENFFKSDLLEPHIDSLYNAIKNDVYADTLKSFSNQNFDDNITTDISIPGPPGVGGTFIGLKSFITARRTAVMTELNANGCAVGINENTLPVNVQLYPNPAENSVRFNTAELPSAASVFTAEGKKVMMVSQLSSQHIDIASLPAGFYFVQFRFADGKTGSAKFIKQ